MSIFARQPTLVCPCVKVHWVENVAYEFVFTRNNKYVSFISLGWFVIWEANDHIAAVFWGAASGICSKQHVAFLCSSYQALISVFRKSLNGATIQ